LALVTFAGVMLVSPEAFAVGFDYGFDEFRVTYSIVPRSAEEH
jgi:hypothetical protein